QTIRRKRVLVGLLRGFHQGSGDVEAPEGELDVRVRLPDFADGAVTRRGDLVLGGPARRLGQLDPTLTRAAVEEFPLERQPSYGIGLALEWELFDADARRRRRVPTRAPTRCRSWAGSRQTTRWTVHPR